MKPNFSNDPSIDALVADLRPVHVLTPKTAFALVAAGTAIMIAFVAANFGLRPDIVAGDPSPIVLLRGGSLLLLAISATVAVTASARPAVGQASNGWQWALSAAALFPVTSLAIAIMKQSYPVHVLSAPSGLWCLGISGVGGLIVGGMLTSWLRKGAPTAIDRVSWLTGLAAGAFGTFAYSLHCPTETVHYIGLWYTAAVAMCAGLGRLIVPRLIRW